MLRTAAATIAASGALLVPSSTAPDNAHLQREIVHLRAQVARLQAQNKKLTTQERMLVCWSQNLAGRINAIQAQLNPSTAPEISVSTASTAGTSCP
jgi:hypothetical protein